MIGNETCDICEIHTGPCIVPEMLLF